MLQLQLRFESQGLRQLTNSTDRGMSRKDPVGEWEPLVFFERAALRTRVWQLRRLDEARRAVRPTDERGEPGSRRCACVWSVWELAAAVRRDEAGGQTRREACWRMLTYAIRRGDPPRDRDLDCPRNSR
jgi:hypothetical protein